MWFGKGGSSTGCMWCRWYLIQVVCGTGGIWYMLYVVQVVFGTGGIWYRLYVVQVVFGTGCMWCRWYLVQVVCGAGGSWYRLYVVQVVLGTGCIWYRLYVVQVVLGTGCMWYRWYLVQVVLVQISQIVFAVCLESAGHILILQQLLYKRTYLSDAFLIPTDPSMMVTFSIFMPIAGELQWRVSSVRTLWPYRNVLLLSVHIYHVSLSMGLMSYNSHLSSDYHITIAVYNDDHR